HRHVLFNGMAEFHKEHLHRVLCVTLVQTELLEHALSQICLGQRSHPQSSNQSRKWALNSCFSTDTTASIRVEISASPRVRECSWKVKPSARLFVPDATLSP